MVVSEILKELSKHPQDEDIGLYVDGILSEFKFGQIKGKTAICINSLEDEIDDLTSSYEKFSSEDEIIADEADDSLDLDDYGDY